ncbi:(2Fe-2S)-binding protein [Candidatus Formimonas warabiya]|uniref:(2Fe-2S)-binding protein n=1 Tax=Formimonas warabiya TaxID=1761012 RepID=A0A3G1KTP7_FORW1|nr:(2Fe-2S)-binding protein [Candidatus Formimonas warabiya]ATW25838.1 (2Fe-2S)-binding protein [Candidatus Formimonas warabiya]
MDKVLLNMVVNGKPVSLEIKPYTRLLDVLRYDLGLTGTKEGCGIGECGACTVIVDGQTVNTCLTLAASMEGRHITTIEGLMENGKMHPIQEAFIKHNAVQCGFCTPGLIMSAKALLDANPEPSREEIKLAISGNLCRCTGYEQIIDAIRDVAGQPNKREIF